MRPTFPTIRKVLGLCRSNTIIRRFGIRASPPMEPTIQPNRHVCSTCIAGTGSQNVKPKLRRSRLNVSLAWALRVGGPWMEKIVHFLQLSSIDISINLLNLDFLINW